MNSRQRLLLLTAGSAGLIMAGAALAQAPGTGGFGQYTVSGGTPALTGGASSNCIGGATCTPLVAASAGFLQDLVSVTAGVGAGSSYILTLVTQDSGVTAAPSGLNFSDESYVGANSNSANLAVQSNVQLGGNGNGPGTASAGVGNALALIARGSLVQTGTVAQVQAGTADALSNDQLGIRISQQNDFTSFTNSAGNAQADANGVRSENFSYVSLLNDNNVGTDGVYMVENMYGTNIDGGQYTDRESSGVFTGCATNPCTLTLPNGATVTYNAGDDIAVSWMDNKAFGGVAAGGFGYPNGTNTGPVSSGGTTQTTTGGGSGNAINDTETFINRTTLAADETAPAYVAYQAALTAYDANPNALNLATLEADYTTAEGVSTTNAIQHFSNGVTQNTPIDPTQATENGYTNNSGESGLAQGVTFNVVNQTGSATNTNGWGPYWSTNFGNVPQSFSWNTSTAALVSPAPTGNGGSETETGQIFP